MRPINANLKPWNDRTANFVLQNIRAKALVELNARDERNSQGQLNAANMYSPYREVKNDRGTGSTFVVDPVLSTLKCTGGELAQLTCKRWAEFCAAPQDEQPHIEELLKATRDKALTRIQAVGQAVEDSLKAAPEPTVLLPATPQRKIREPALAKV